MKIQKHPFDHVIIDDFLSVDTAEALSLEVPDYDAPVWFSYDNAIEKKHACNNWHCFPPHTYQLLCMLASPAMVADLGTMFGIDGLECDIGLHGGGWHMHKRGGKLNVHKDYSIHPKLKKQRRLNFILYLSQDWQEEWGGGLELWSHDEEKGAPKRCEKIVPCLFNRAVIFRTDQQSWHGLPSPLDCPEGRFRKSLAVYYVSPADDGASERQRALFAPTPEQGDDESVLRLIRERQR